MLICSMLSVGDEESAELRGLRLKNSHFFVSLSPRRGVTGATSLKVFRVLQQVQSHEERTRVFLLGPQTLIKSSTILLLSAAAWGSCLCQAHVSASASTHLSTPASTAPACPASVGAGLPRL